MFQARAQRFTQSLLPSVLLSFGFSRGLWFVLWGLFGTPPSALVILGAWGPTVAALLVTARAEGRAGLKLLLSRFLRWRVAPVCCAVAVFGPLTVALVATLLASPLGAPTLSLVAVAARFGLNAERAPLLFALLPVIFLVTFASGGPLAEELGWRGFAQTRLQAQLRPTTAGLLIGVVWALWHLPLFFIAPAATAGLPLALYLPLVVALGLLSTWAQLGAFVLLLWGLVGVVGWLESHRPRIPQG